MCRIFGFRSVIDSQVHSSLVGAENALVNQSSFHADGWGVAYYLASTPHVVKSDRSAFEDSLFTKLSGIVSAKTVIAHLRKSTIGENSAVNTHPFQHGRWTFAHNGNVRSFKSLHPNLISLVNEKLRKYILGHTDSEILFYIILTELEKLSPIYQNCTQLDPIVEATRQAVNSIVKICGPPLDDDNGAPSETYLSFVLTDGNYMVAFHGGKNLFYSTYKTKCPERDSCASFNPYCEAAAQGNPVNHLIFSSEQLHGENIWHALKFGELIGIDEKMKVHHHLLI